MIKLYSYLFATALTFISTASWSQKYGDAQIKVAYINQFAQSIVWQNEANIDTFDIGVFRADTSIANELLLLARTKRFRNKQPINIKKITDIKDVTKVDLMYVSNDMTPYIDDMFFAITGKNVLLVSDRSSDRKYVMINLLPIVDKTMKFEIHKSNLISENFKIKDDLLLFGGSEIDVAQLYRSNVDSLKAEQQRVEQQRLTITQQQQAIAQQQTELTRQRSAIDSQRVEIRNQQRRIDDQRALMGKLSVELQGQQRLLNEKIQILNQQEKAIADQEQLIQIKQAEADAKEKILKKTSDEIQEKQKRIQAQNEILDQQKIRIESQQTVLYIILISLLLFLILLYFVFRNYRKAQRLNKELGEKNIAITQQNLQIQQKTEEIQAQSEQLELTNKELEKLSIVASETDNAVMIFNQNAELEWVNAGFIRMTGYSYEEYIAQNGKNLRQLSNNPRIGLVIDDCIKNKKTVIYETSSRTKAGEEIWVQTTLTPILDSDGKITKLVAIDADISKLKEAETAIRQQNEEIMSQRDKLEYQNQQITGSIRYAKTIQSAILPSPELMNNHLETFVLYKPKDIVSGDFYWASHLPARDELTEKTFIAAVDCTGHGVPGAFMSMIGSRLLNEIVNEKKILRPSDILTKLNYGVIHSLRQEQTDNTDGMDICLCRFERVNGATLVTFSGAKRSLYYYSHQQKEIIEIKSDRKSIGGAKYRTDEEEFTDTEIVLQTNDLIYLCTDGIIDQNGSDRKRFGSKRLKDTLLDASQLSFDKQKQHIEEKLSKYQGDEEQRDDITFIGIRIP